MKAIPITSTLFLAEGICCANLPNTVRFSSTIYGPLKLSLGNEAAEKGKEFCGAKINE